MPHTKRPLSEVDPNASTTARKAVKIENTKSISSTPTNQTIAREETAPGLAQPSTPSLSAISTSRRWIKPTTIFQGADTLTEQLEDEKEEIEYRHKDNSKLRRLLSERCLPTWGTREELIDRLEKSSINYADLTSTQLTEMLKDRHLTMCALGNKEAKIERLRLNDKIQRDTGNSKECMLYASLSVAEEMLHQRMEEQKKIDDDKYTAMGPAKLSTLLQRRKMSTSGSKTVLIKRLQANDRKTIVKELEASQKRHDTLKEELESKTGQAVNASEALKREDDLRAMDYKIQNGAQKSRLKIPICDYDWKDSHWASRTERELIEICSRRGMPGYGPKAAMLKWLDTGNIGYEEMYVGGLARICSERGIKHKENDKKVDLIKRLREADGDA